MPDIQYPQADYFNSYANSNPQTGAGSAPPPSNYSGSNPGPWSGYLGSLSPGAQTPYLAQDYGLSAALQYGQAQAGPQFAMQQQYRDSLASQLGYTNANQANETGYLNSTNANQLAGLNLQGQGITDQQSSLARLRGYYGNLNDLANRGFNLQDTAAWQQAQQSAQGAMSSATARGAVLAPGISRTYGNIQEQLANTLAGTQINREKQATDYTEQLASNTDQGKALDLRAQQLGIDRNQLGLELQRGLDRLGFSSSMSIADLMDKMTGSSIQDATLANQIFNQAIQNSDYFSQFYAPPAPDVNKGPGYRGPT